MMLHPRDPEEKSIPLLQPHFPALQRPGLCPAAPVPLQPLPIPQEALLPGQSGCSCPCNQVKPHQRTWEWFSKHRERIAHSPCLKGSANGATEPRQSRAGLVTARHTPQRLPDWAPLSPALGARQPPTLPCRPLLLSHPAVCCSQRLALSKQPAPGDPAEPPARLGPGAQPGPGAGGGAAPTRVCVWAGLCFLTCASSPRKVSLCHAAPCCLCSQVPTWATQENASSPCSIRAPGG